MEFRHFLSETPENAASNTREKSEKKEMDRTDSAFRNKATIGRRKEEERTKENKVDENEEMAKAKQKESAADSNPQTKKQDHFDSRELQLASSTALPSTALPSTTMTVSQVNMPFCSLYVYFISIEPDIIYSIGQRYSFFSQKRRKKDDMNPARESALQQQH